VGCVRSSWLQKGIFRASFFTAWLGRRPSLLGMLPCPISGEQTFQRPPDPPHQFVHIGSWMLDVRCWMFSPLKFMFPNPHHPPAGPLQGAACPDECVSGFTTRSRVLFELSLCRSVSGNRRFVQCPSVR
jgi:hypothetical protein